MCVCVVVVVGGGEHPGIIGRVIVSQTSEGTPPRVHALYERALAVCYSDEGLWTEYARCACVRVRERACVHAAGMRRFCELTLRAAPAITASIWRRGVRNCLWSGARPRRGDCAET